MSPPYNLPTTYIRITTKPILLYFTEMPGDIGFYDPNIETRPLQTGELK